MTPKQPTDEALLKLLKTDGKRAMGLLFEKHYANLCRVSLRIVKDTNAAEDIAQDVFCHLWKKRDELEIKTAPGAYLRMAVRNRSLNYIKSRRINFDPEGKEMVLEDEVSTTQQNLEADELEQFLHKAIDNLPDKARIPFCLNRFEDMTYNEIAEQLGVSVKTVEYQVSKALTSLRRAIGEV